MVRLVVLARQGHRAQLELWAARALLALLAVMERPVRPALLALLDRPALQERGST